MPKANIQWNRSEDGFVESKDGRFEIEPLFIGRTTPQEYVLFLVRRDESRRQIGIYDTHAEAKYAAQKFRDKD
jgi:hypothetical protein